MLSAEGIECRLRTRYKSRKQVTCQEINHEKPTVVVETNEDYGTKTTTVTAVVKLNSEVLSRRSYFMDWWQSPDAEPQSFWCKLTSEFHKPPRYDTVEEFLESETWICKDRPESQKRSTEFDHVRREGKLPIPKSVWHTTEMGSLRLELFQISDIKFFKSNADVDRLTVHFDDNPFLIFVFLFQFDADLDSSTRFLDLSEPFEPPQLSQSQLDQSTRALVGEVMVTQSKSTQKSKGKEKEDGNTKGKGKEKEKENANGKEVHTQASVTELFSTTPASPWRKRLRRTSGIDYRDADDRNEDKGKGKDNDLDGNYDDSDDGDSADEEFEKGDDEREEYAEHYYDEGYSSLYPNPSENIVDVDELEVDYPVPSTRPQRQCQPSSPLSDPEDEDYWPGRGRTGVGRGGNGGGTNPSDVSGTVISWGDLQREMDLAEIALKREKDESARLDAEISAFTNEQATLMKDKAINIQAENERKRKYIEFLQMQA